MTPENPGGEFEDWSERRRRKWEARRQRRMARRTYGGVSAGHGEGLRLVVGAVVLLLGVLFLLENLGYIPAVRWGAFWPVLLIALGVSRLVEARGSSRQLGGAVLLVIGLVFLAINLGFLPPLIWRLLWPVLLILGGVLLLVRGFDARLEFRGAFHHDVGSSSDNILNEYAIFGGVNRRVDSQDFQGGEAIAVFGGIEIDLHRASTTREQVEVEANAIFGGVEIWAPDNWDVVVQGASILGGFDDKTHRAPDDGVKRPRMIIRGSALFGGVVVKN
jgi:predicted membrane protein